jgi:RNA polymerase sigma-70 factor (sigma-E family)
MGDHDREFVEFFTTAWPRLLRTTYAVCGDAQVSEDAVQDAFVKAYAVWGRVRRADDSFAYLRRMAINEVFSRKRKASSRRERLSAAVPEPRRAGSDDPFRAGDEVWAAVVALPPRQRAVVVLRYYEDLSEAQIADALGCRPGTVKSQASAAMATLRARLGAGNPVTEGDRS